MTPRIRASLVLLAAVLLAGAAGPAPQDPLTNEEIVRRVASGEGARTILEAIAARPPGYDLDPDLLDEMVRAGVPRTVIEAMKSRGRVHVGVEQHVDLRERAPADQRQRAVFTPGGELQRIA